VDRLARDAKRIADLLPGPAQLSGVPHASRFDLLGQAKERAHGAQTNGWVVWFLGHKRQSCLHVRQSKLTEAVLSIQTDSFIGNSPRN
jgi:hypothetical protein